MTNTATRIVLFLSSYAPLFGILALREWHGNRPAAWVFLGLTVSSVIVLFQFLKTVGRRADGTVHVGTVSSLAGDSMSYLFTYLLPFLDLDLTDGHYLASVIVFFLIIAVIYVRSNMIYINPVLTMAGYQIFRVETDYGNEVALITRRSHVPGNASVEAVRLGDHVLFEKGR